MGRFLVRRLFGAFITILLISLFVVFTLRLSGDPTVALMQGTGGASPEQMAQMRHALGIDRPFYQQYLSYMGGLFRGDLGTSFRTGQPVGQLIAGAMPATLELAFASIALALVISVPLGVLSAVRRGGLLDMAVRMLSLLGLSFPNFWLGIMLILVFAVGLGWFPPSGYGSGVSLVLPSLTLTLILSSTLVRLVRSTMLDALSQQYVQTERAKGLAEAVVIYRHALRNALIPTVTFAGLQFGVLLGGTVIVEQVFSWPGAGRMVLDAISYRDYPVVQGSIIFLAIPIVAVNFLVDFSYGLLDPRVKVGGEA